MADVEEKIHAKQQEIEVISQMLDVFDKYRALEYELSGVKQRSDEIEKVLQRSLEQQARIERLRESLRELPDYLRPLDIERLRRLVPLLEKLEELEGRRDATRSREEEVAKIYAAVTGWPEGRLAALEAHIDAMREEAMENVGHAPAQEAAAARLPVWRAASLVALLLSVVCWLLLRFLIPAPWSGVLGVVTGLVVGLLVAVLLQRHERQRMEERAQTRSVQGASSPDTEASRSDATYERVRAWIPTDDVTELARLAERRRMYESAVAEIEALKARYEIERDEVLRAIADVYPLDGSLLGSSGEVRRIRKDAMRAIDVLKELKMAEDDLNGILESFGVASVEELEHKSQTRADRRISLRRELDDLVRSHGFLQKAIEAGLEAIEIQEDSLRHKRQRLEEEVAVLDRTRQARQRELDLLRLQLQRASELNVADAERELKAIEEEIKRLETRCEAIAQAHRLLGEAAERFAQSHAQAIGDCVTRLFARWTGGTQRVVRVSADFSLEVVEDQTPVPRPVEWDALSQGARDQLALAVRVAALQRVGSEVALPLLIDDAFLTWDALRLGNLKEHLAEIASEQQVVLVTHDETFSDWGVPVRHELAA